MTFPSDPLLPEQGQLVGNRYRVLDTIGQGGMGVVYRAEDVVESRAVALKTLRLPSPEELFRLKREFRALVTFDHPNLVRLYELIVSGGTCCFTMEYVDGVDFVRYVLAGPGADDAAGRALRCRRALRQLAEGLRAVHARGMMHRDVKPPNVLVDRAERVVLLDFGLVRDLLPSESTSSAAGLAGTLAYMAPEVVWGAEVTVAADWYSVGVMAYEALTGSPPYPGTLLESLVERRRRHPKPPRELVPDLDPDLDALVMRLLEPKPAQRADGDAILACVGASPPAPDEVVPLPGEFSFVGRTPELATLRAAFDASLAGSPVLATIEGPSGIGKTTLAQRAVAAFEAQARALVLHSICHPREHLPFKAIDGVLDGLGRYLARLEPAQLGAVLPRHAAALSRVFPVLGRVRGIADLAAARRLPPEPQELRRVAVGALRELLFRLADTRPVVMWIDDLHWGDIDSVLLLRDLLRPPEPPPVLLVCAFRRDDLHGTPLDAALRQELLPVLDGGRSVVLAPLAHDEARDLASSILSGRAASHVARVVDESGGMPFLLTELSCGLTATGEEAPPPSLDALLAGRLALLPPAARDVLEAVAVAGHPLAETVAVAAAGASGASAEVVALLQRLRLVRSVPVAQGIGLTTLHDRVAQAVLARTSVQQRSAWHARIAQALEVAPGVDPEVLVDHYAESGRLPDAAACAYAAAEKAAEALAFNRAASLYRRAIDLGGTEHPHWMLHERLGEALINAGFGADGARKLVEAARELERAGGDGLTILRLKRRAAEHLMRSYRRDEGLQLMREVLSAFDLPFPSSVGRAILSMLTNRLRWRWLRRFGRPGAGAASDSAWEKERLETCWSAGLGFSIFDIMRASDYQARHAVLAWRAGDPRQLARAIAGEAQILSWEGGRTKRRRAGELHREATAIARGLNDPQVDAHRMLMMCISALAESRHRDIVASAEEGMRVCRERCLGVSWELVSLQCTYVSSLVLQGQFRRLWQEFEPMLREADERDDSFGFMMLRIGLVNAAWLGIDQPEEARAQLAATEKEAIGNPWVFYQTRYAEAQIALYTGRPEAAWEPLVAARQVLRRSQMLRMMIIRKFFHEILTRTAIALAASGVAPARRDALLREAGRYIRKMARDDAPGLEPHVDALRAGLRALQGDAESARRDLERAAAGFDEIGEGIGAASARLALGSLLGGEAGAALRGGAEAWLTEHGVVKPARMAALLVPGFTAPS